MPISAANTLYGLTSIEQYTVLSARCYNAFQLVGVHNVLDDKQHVLQILGEQESRQCPVCLLLCLPMQVNLHGNESVIMSRTQTLVPFLHDSMYNLLLYNSRSSIPS